VAQTFTKHYEDQFSARAEAAGLNWLAEAEAVGGVRVARVLQVSDHELTEEKISEGYPSRDAAFAFGAALAHTHAAGAPWFGAPPPDHPGTQFVGRAEHQLVLQAPKDLSEDTWGRFYARYKIMSHALAADRLGNIPGKGLLAIAELADHLARGDFDAPQPTGIPRVARLHGDLWAGNVLWEPEPGSETDGSESSSTDVSGEEDRRSSVSFSTDFQGGTRRWTGAVLIDPLAHGGHAETDLAMLELFGLPNLNVVIDGYQSVAPLAPGWRDRVKLHQLYPLLMHAQLFGNGYGRQAVEAAKRYL
jgi:fructosamine-3-kinase